MKNPPKVKSAFIALRNSGGLGLKPVLQKNDATDRKAAGLIVVMLWAGIITEEVQAPGVGIRVSTLGPPAAVRTLIDGSARLPEYVA